MLKQPFPLGAISTGTLRCVDLIGTFADAVERLAGPEDAGVQAEVREAREMLKTVTPDAHDADTEAGDDCTLGDYVEVLHERLEELAPDYVTFGAAEGDGACFGFWPDMEALEEAVADGEVLKVADRAAVPGTYDGPVMIVNDRGNVTYGVHRVLRDDGRMRFVYWETVWECV